MLFHMPHHLMQNTHGWKRENTEFLPLFGVLQMPLALMIAEALWVDLQHCYKLGLAVKVAKGIIALAVCPGLNVWIAAHQGKSSVFAHAFIH